MYCASDAVFGKQIRVLQWDTDSNRFSSMLSIGLIILSITFPGIIIGVLFYFQKRLREQKFRNRIGAVYESLNCESRAALLYNVFFVSRRLLFATTVVVLGDHPFAQIILMFLQSLSLLMYVIQAKPFEVQELNRIEIFNEICILMSSYHLICFTDFLPDVDIQYNIGFSLIAITGLNVAVNTSIMMIKTFGKIKMNIKKAIQYYKDWRHKQALKKAEKYLEKQDGYDFQQKVYKNLQKHKVDDKFVVTPSSGLIHKEDTILDATASYVNNANKIKRTQTNNFFESYVSMPTRKTSLGFDSPVKRQGNNLIKNIFGFFNTKVKKEMADDTFSGFDNSSDMMRNDNESSPSPSPSKQSRLRSMHLSELEIEAELESSQQFMISPAKVGTTKHQQEATYSISPEVGFEVASPSNQPIIQSQNSITQNESFILKPNPVQLNNQVTANQQNSKFTFRDIMANLNNNRKEDGIQDDEDELEEIEDLDYQRQFL